MNINFISIHDDIIKKGILGLAENKVLVDTQLHNLLPTRNQNKTKDTGCSVLHTAGEQYFTMLRTRMSQICAIALYDG